MHREWLRGQKQQFLWTAGLTTPKRGGAGACFQLVTCLLSFLRTGPRTRVHELPKLTSKSENTYGGKKQLAGDSSGANAGASAGVIVYQARDCVRALLCLQSPLRSEISFSHRSPARGGGASYTSGVAYTAITAGLLRKVSDSPPIPCPLLLCSPQSTHVGTLNICGPSVQARTASMLRLIPMGGEKNPELHS